MFYWMHGSSVLFNIFNEIRDSTLILATQCKIKIKISKMNEIWFIKYFTISLNFWNMRKKFVRKHISAFKKYVLIFQLDMHRMSS